MSQLAELKAEDFARCNLSYYPYGMLLAYRAGIIFAVWWLSGPVFLNLFVGATSTQITPQTAEILIFGPILISIFTGLALIIPIIQKIFAAKNKHHLILQLDFDVGYVFATFLVHSIQELTGQDDWSVVGRKMVDEVQLVDGKEVTVRKEQIVQKDDELVGLRATGWHTWRIAVSISQALWWYQSLAKFVSFGFYKPSLYQPVDEFIVVSEGTSDKTIGHWEEGRVGYEGIEMTVPDTSPMYARYLRSKQYLNKQKPVPIIRSLGDRYVSSKAQDMAHMKTLSHEQLRTVEKAYDSEVARPLQLQLEGEREKVDYLESRQLGSEDLAGKMADERTQLRGDALGTEGESVGFKKWVQTKTGIAVVIFFAMFLFLLIEGVRTGVLH